MRRAFICVLLLVLSAACRAGTTASNVSLKGARIVIGPHAHPLEVLAARELQRYLGLIGAGRCEISATAKAGGTVILLGTAASQPALAAQTRGADLGEEGFVLRALPAGRGTCRLVVAGETPQAVLWGVYSLLERLGIGFYLGGDALAGAGPPQVPASLDVVSRPAFKVRGSLPWYNFLNSPTTWDRDDFRYFFDQMAKMRNNFVGFHSYDSEPFCAYEFGGKLVGGEPLVTAHNYGWGTVQGLATGQFGFGTGDFFFGPEFGSRPATMPDSREQAIRRQQALLAEGLNYARARGIKVCVGFEVSGDPTTPENQDRLVARLTALMKSYPMLDYVWIWQSEGLGGGSEVAASGSPFEAMTERYGPEFRYLESPSRMHEAVRVMLYARLAHGILKRLAPKTRMIVSGWGGDRWMRFSDFYLGLDRTLPKDVVFAALDNIDPTSAPAVADVYGKLSPGRERWPIPWWESDGGFTRRDQWGPQCNARPFVALCRDSLAKGCQGMLAIHWRTRDVEEAAAFEAQFAWNPKLTYEGFFDEFARRCYGARNAKEMGAIHRDLEALGPRYTGAYGQVECGGFEWFSDGRLPVPANLDRLAALRRRIVAVRGAMARERQSSGLARVDWLLSTIDWLIRYDRAAMTLRPGGPVDSLLKQSEEARRSGDTARADGLAGQAAAAFRNSGLDLAMRTFPWKMTTCGEWGSLATINVKAYAAYTRLADRIRAAGGDPGRDDRSLPPPGGPPRIVMPTPPGIVEPGKPVEVKAIVIGADTARVEYRAPGEATPRAVPMRNSFRRAWTAVIPGPAVTGRGIQYRVVASGRGQSARSPLFTASGLTLPAPPQWRAPVASAPGPVSDIRAALAPDYQVRLTWTAPDGAESMVTREPGEPGVFPVRTRLGEYVDNRVTAGNTYRYSVAAVDARGAPAKASVASVEVPRSAPPPAPLQLTARSGPGKVRLAWQPVPGTVRGYRVYRYRAGDDAGQCLTAQPAPRAGYLDTRVAADEDVSYRVSAVDRGGQEGERSAPVTTRSLARPEGPLVALPLRTSPDGGEVRGQIVGSVFTPEEGGALDTRRGGYVVYPHRAEFELEGGFAVSLRFRADTVEQMPVLADCGEFMKQGWFVQIIGGVVRFSLGGENILDAGRIAPGRWHHLVCSYDGDRMRTYLDGRETGSRAAPSVDFRPWPGPMYVAQYHFLQEPYQFRGLLSDLRIYAYAPSVEEVARDDEAPRR